MLAFFGAVVMSDVVFLAVVLVDHETSQSRKYTCFRTGLLQFKHRQVCSLFLVRMHALPRLVSHVLWNKL